MLRHACGFKLANDGHDTRALQPARSRTSSGTRGCELRNLQWLVPTGRPCVFPRRSARPAPARRRQLLSYPGDGPDLRVAPC